MLFCFFPQFEYTLTCAVCTKPQEKEMRVLGRISQVSIICLYLRIETNAGITKSVVGVELYISGLSKSTFPPPPSKKKKNSCKQPLENR